MFALVSLRVNSVTELTFNRDQTDLLALIANQCFSVVASQFGTFSSEEVVCVSRRTINLAANLTAQIVNESRIASDFLTNIS